MFKALQKLAVVARSPEMFQHLILPEYNENVGAYYVILCIELEVT